jgi:O-acetyl-ADP-ribose deacetylase (regulator of RNase III)
MNSNNTTMNQKPIIHTPANNTTSQPIPAIQRNYINKTLLEIPDQLMSDTSGYTHPSGEIKPQILGEYSGTGEWFVNDFKSNETGEDLMWVTRDIDIIIDASIDHLSRIWVTSKSIFDIKCRAMVNPANNDLSHGGGLCGKFFDQCVTLQQSFKQGQRCESGETVVTLPHSLGRPSDPGCRPALAHKGSCNMIAHTVGPNLQARCTGGKWPMPTKSEIDILSSCVTTVLESAEEVSTRKTGVVAFPAISCGIFRFKPKIAAAVMIEAMLKYMVSRPDNMTFIVISCPSYGERDRQNNRDFGRYLKARESHILSGVWPPNPYNKNNSFDETPE